MTDPREILARIRKQADAAREGPWDYQRGHDTPSGWFDAYVLGADGESVVSEAFDGDAEFIAAARTTVPALLDALEAVLEIHQDGGESQGYLDDGSYGDMPHCCTECGSLGEYGVLWPCPTVEAITTALEATK